MTLQVTLTPEIEPCNHTLSTHSNRNGSAACTKVIMQINLLYQQLLLMCSYLHAHSVSSGVSQSLANTFLWHFSFHLGCNYMDTCLLTASSCTCTMLHSLCIRPLRMAWLSKMTPKTVVIKRTISQGIFNNKVALTWWGAETTQRFILSRLLNWFFVGKW